MFHSLNGENHIRKMGLQQLTSRQRARGADVYRKEKGESWSVFVDPRYNVVLKVAPLHSLRSKTSHA